YRLSGIYQVYFSRRGSFAKLQAALGFDPDHVWTEDERRRFQSAFHYFKDAFYKLGGRKLPITAADALLVWLSYYPIGSIKELTVPEITKTLSAIWSDLKAKTQAEPIEVSIDDAEEAPQRHPQPHLRLRLPPEPPERRLHKPPGPHPQQLDIRSRPRPPHPRGGHEPRGHRPQLQPRTRQRRGRRHGAGRRGRRAGRLRHHRAPHLRLPQARRASSGDKGTQLLRRHALPRRAHLYSASARAVHLSAIATMTKSDHSYRQQPHLRRPRRIAPSPSAPGSRTPTPA
ncbi:MAG: hypothetical protein ACLUEK_05640, partial [Oscillospiraceae bacterium]